MCEIFDQCVSLLVGINIRIGKQLVLQVMTEIKAAGKPNLREAVAKHFLCLSHLFFTQRF
jgi:hypothetical protein